jgi:hypothetical protein
MRSNGLVYLVVAFIAVIVLAGACSAGYFVGRITPSDFTSEYRYHP